MLKHINGFDQFQGQTGSALLGSLAASGYTVSPGMALASGRHASTFALEMRPSPGTAGTSWSGRQNNARQALRGVATNNEGKWIGVGDQGVALVSLDTITWQPLTLGVNVKLTAVHNFERNGTKRWIVVGTNGTLLVSDDDGTSWSPRATALTGATFNDVFFADDTLVIVGENSGAGCILISNNGGESWGIVPSGQSGSLPNYCVRHGDGRWMVGGGQGQIRTSLDNGLAWAASNTGVTTGVTGLAYGDGVWITPSTRTLRQSADGAAWTEIANNLGVTGDSFFRIAFTPGRWVLAGTRSKLLTSEDHLTWTQRLLTGGTSVSEVTALAVATGDTSGMVAVGTLIGTGPTAYPLVFASLAPPTVLGYRLTTEANRIVIGFCHRATARGRIFSVANLFDLDWPGALSIIGQLSAAIPIRNAWYYYELVIDKAAATVSLFVNNTVDIVVPLPPAVATMTQFDLTWLAENGAVARLDDLYLLDSATTDGAALVNRLGPVRIPIRLPTADVDVNWEGSSPGDHYALVGLLPPSETSYVRSATSGAQEVFSSSTALPPAASTILAVGVMALARKSDLDNRQLGLVVGTGSEQKEVIDTTLSISSEYSFGHFEKAPDGSAWTPANIISTPFGVVVRP